MVTALTDDEFAVLNAVYLRKIASTDVIEDISGLPESEIASAVTAAVDRGRLVDVGGMYMLSETGTADLLGGYADRYQPLRSDAAVLAWYDRFESINRQFLQAVSAWQTEAGSDPTRLDRLLRLVERLVKSLAAIEPTIPRYQRYSNRFEAALQHIDTGETEFVTSPTKDSVHNIWFEFHEDILTVIGRPRDLAEA